MSELHEFTSRLLRSAGSIRTSIHELPLDILVVGLHKPARWIAQ